jgi:hypothetical protein
MLTKGRPVLLRVSVAVRRTLCFLRHDPHRDVPHHAHLPSTWEPDRIRVSSVVDQLLSVYFSSDLQMKS